MESNTYMHMQCEDFIIAFSVTFSPFAVKQFKYIMCLSAHVTPFYSCIYEYWSID